MMSFCPRQSWTSRIGTGEERAERASRRGRSLTSSSDVGNTTSQKGDLGVSSLADDLSSNVKLFADDTSLFSVVQYVNASARELNDDLEKINKWGFQRKMSFNPNPIKQGQ